VDLPGRGRAPADRGAVQRRVARRSRRRRWRKPIPYRNLRHHAVLWWKAKLIRSDTEEPTDWDTIADWSGHDVRTLLAYYVIPSEEATKRARGASTGSDRNHPARRRTAGLAPRPQELQELRGAVHGGRQLRAASVVQAVRDGPQSRLHRAQGRQAGLEDKAVSLPPVGEPDRVGGVRRGECAPGRRPCRADLTDTWHQ
jgi:hypothetical protein